MADVMIYAADINVGLGEPEPCYDLGQQFTVTGEVETTSISTKGKNSRHHNNKEILQ